MEQIWAPWRIEYVRMEEVEGCILCEKPRKNNDAESYILHRGEKNFVFGGRPPPSAHAIVSDYPNP